LQFIYNAGVVFLYTTVKISAVIISFNESANIRDAIKSVEWADEILVVDSGSTDNTRETAAALGAKVLRQEWLGFGRQKQFAVDNAAHEWIFSLDADERVSPELMDEIMRLKALKQGSLGDGYRIPRRSVYMGREIRGGGWYPDRQLRLFNRNLGKWKDVAIHESVEMSPGAKVENLHGDIMHYSISGAAYHHKQIGERYAPLAARQMFESGRRTSRFQICTAGSITFIRTYFLKAGFRDGLAGFVIARFAAHHAFLKHLLLWDMQNDDEKK
jgi:glycosyltransferase involved in cell wall biosynthesis